MIDVAVMVQGRKHMATCGVTAFALEPPLCMTYYYYLTLGGLPSLYHVFTVSVGVSALAEVSGVFQPDPILTA